MKWKQRSINLSKRKEFIILKEKVNLLLSLPRKKLRKPFKKETNEYLNFIYLIL